MYDLILLTDARYIAPKNPTAYTDNILLEDHLLTKSLEERGLKVGRTYWDNPDFDWRSTRFVVLRTTWDYFDRFDEFSAWLQRVNRLTQLINPLPILEWNMDKHYLVDLNRNGIAIPNTIFIEMGERRSLSQIAEESGWEEWVLKPAVSGAGRHTYRLKRGDLEEYESRFKELIGQEAMLLQEFQASVIERGEATFVLFGGQYSHAVLKKAKRGDFRVQDDFGGTVHHYQASAQEIALVGQVMSCISPTPVYARVDLIWDKNGQQVVSELEMVEPELWMRFHAPAAEAFAEALHQYMTKNRI